MGYAHIWTQHLSTKLIVWPQIITSMMASDEHTLPYLWWVSTHFVCGSCGLHKVHLQWLQHKHKLCCFREVYGADMKIPEFLDIIQLRDPNGAITMKKNGQHYWICWVCCGVVASRYHDNRHECSFPGRAYKWLSGLGCKHKNPLPGPFKAITSTKGDNLKSERNISLKNYLSQGGRECDILHNPAPINLEYFFKRPNLLWLFSIHLQI